MAEITLSTLCSLPTALLSATDTAFVPVGRLLSRARQRSVRSGRLR